VGFTFTLLPNAKWALILKLWPFKANKHLNPVSKMSASEALIYRPEMTATPLKTNEPMILNSENGPWG
jgi:hypothetical protein